MKIMNKFIFGSCFLLCMGLYSCEDYLSKAPESTISEEDAFLNFRNFQGFVEELYCCLPAMSQSTWNSEFNMADEVLSPSRSDYRMNAEWDKGNYWAWKTGGGGWDNCWLDDKTANTTPDNPFNKGLWPLCWYGIRKCNVGLENINKLVEASDEERDIIKGQLLFFRGFFHFELMSFWGGLPYIDRVLSSSEKLMLPRLNYRETALKAAEDLEAAAHLLPNNWDNVQTGQATLGNNYQRINSSVAYAYLGKDLLYAASPMMNQELTGNASYDTELCKRAAVAFTKVLQMSKNGESPYTLQQMANYSNNFYTMNNNIPGRPEVMMAPPIYSKNRSHWSLIYMYLPPILGGEANISCPAANYVDYYGMANGLPIDDPDSGYDKTEPWINRDPRFYTDVIYDGERMVNSSSCPEDCQYANLYTGGNMRSSETASRTGYLMHKYIDLAVNKYDNQPDNISILVPYLRLADVYLMYAEAVLYGYGSFNSTALGYGLTALEAVNVIRNRAGIGPIPNKYLTSNDTFMERLIVERAVEFAFEGGLRWMDLRRWNLADAPQYLKKTGIEFDRDPNNKGKIINLRYTTVKTRVFEKKHKWLPLPLDQVTLYPDFGQNPGW